MRIESTSNGSSYEQQAQPTKQQGTESKSVEIKKTKPDITTQTKIENRNAQVAAEVRQQQNDHEVIRAIEKANKHIRTYDRRLEFSIHDATKQIMVKVINTADDSIIREIPSERVLDMVGHMWEMAGILVDEKR